VPSDIINSAPEISDDTKLAYLLPTTTEEGICSTALVDFLAMQHNEFLEYCYKNLPSSCNDPQ